MHWQAAIKTSPPPPPFPSSGGWDPSSGVFFNFGCFSRRFCRAPVLHFTFCFLFFFFPPSSHAFHSVSSALAHLLSPLISPLFFPQPPSPTQRLLLSSRLLCSARACFFDRTRKRRVKEGEGGGEMDDPKLSTDTCCMLALTRPCAFGGARHLCRRVDCTQQKNKKTISTRTPEPTQVDFLGVNAEICCNAK